MAKKNKSNARIRQPKPSDAFFKRGLSKLQLVKKLLQLLLDPQEVQRINWATLQPAKDSLVTKKLKRLNIDLLYTVKYNDNTDLVLMLLIEHKSHTPLKDDVVELKLMEYEMEVYKAVKDYRKEENTLRRKQAGSQPLIDTPFPNISTIVVHHGRSPWNAPDWQTRRGLPQQLPANHAPRGLRYSYYLHDLSRMTDQEVLAFYQSSAELLVMALLMKHSHDKSLHKLEALLLLARNIKSAQEGFILFEELSEYMLTFTEPENYEHVITIAEQFDPTLKEDVMTIAEALEQRGEARGEARGVAIGEAKGKAEGKADGLNISKLIIKALRAGEADNNIAEKYQVPLQQVTDLKEAMGL